MATNQAAWLKAAKQDFIIDEAPMPEPQPNEIILRSHAFAINPADVVMAKRGMIIVSYPTVIGCDVAGTITAIGSAVSRFTVGDRVIACSDYTADVRANKGCFQLYCAVYEALTVHLPENVSFTDGCVLPLASCTAAVSLFQKGNLELPYPKLSPISTGQVLVVWGGSSSVGCCAIQMGKAAGFEVATTCSERNFEYCKSLGADWVFDHRKESVVEDVVKALKDAQQLGGAMKLATVRPGPPTPLVVPEGTVPEDVQVCYCRGTSLKNDEVGPAVLGNWLSPALANGSMKCKPDANVVGKGLESLQRAIDIMEKGVSAKKLVVEVP